MNCFQVDLNYILKIILLGKETLIPPRQHCTRTVSEYVLYVVTRGSLSLSVNGSPITLAAGDVCLFQAGDRQLPMESSFCEYYYVHFLSDHIHTADLTPEAYAAFLRKKQEQCLRTDAFSPRCYDFLNVLIRRESHIPTEDQLSKITDILQGCILTAECKLPEKRFRISGDVASLLLQLESASMQKTNHADFKPEKTYDTVRKIAAYIEQHDTEAFSGERIAREFYLNFDYANRIFRKITGCTIVRYRNLVRIQHAKAKMRATNAPVKEIAAKLGFENVHDFSRIFKKFEGLSPSDYKRKFMKISDE